MNNDVPAVLLRRDGAVASLILNRPAQRNAIDIPMAQAFLACCAELAADSSVRAVVLKGVGKTFGAGGDLSLLRSDSVNNADQLIGPMHQAIRLLAGMDAPVIASLHGAVAGGSLSMAMACDLVIAADNTCFNLAYVNVGTSCDLGGSWSLPRLVGLRNAMAIALLGDTFDASEALRLGLVNQLVPEEMLAAATDALAHRLAAGPTLAIGRTKRLLRDSFEHDLGSQLDRERDSFRACAGTSDFAEALDAFFSKRPANFTGR